MTFLIVYMMIALATMLYLPIVRARITRRLRDVPRERVDLMTDRERKLLLYSVDGVERPLPTWTLVVGGLLWPTNLVAYIGSTIWGWFYARRARRAEDVQCLCPGCGQNLINGHNVDAVIEPEGWKPDGDAPDAIRFFCGQCGVMSEWDLKGPIPALQRSVKPDIAPIQRNDRAS